MRASRDGDVFADDVARPSRVSLLQTWTSARAQRRRARVRTRTVTTLPGATCACVPRASKTRKTRVCGHRPWAVVSGMALVGPTSCPVRWASVCTPGLETHGRSSPRRVIAGVPGGQEGKRPCGEPWRSLPGGRWGREVESTTPESAGGLTAEEPAARLRVSLPKPESGSSRLSTGSLLHPSSLCFRPHGLLVAWVSVSEFPSSCMVPPQ